MKLSSGVEPTSRSQSTATKSLIARNRSHAKLRGNQARETLPIRLGVTDFFGQSYG